MRGIWWWSSWTSRPASPITSKLFPTPWKPGLKRRACGTDLPSSDRKAELAAVKPWRTSNAHFAESDFGRVGVILPMPDFKHRAVSDQALVAGRIGAVLDPIILPGGRICWRCAMSGLLLVPFQKTWAFEQLTEVYFAHLRESMREPFAKHCDVISCVVAVSGNRLPRRHNQQCRIPLSSGRNYSSGSPRIMHQRTNSQIAPPHSVASQATDIQTSTSSRVIRRPQRQTRSVGIRSS